MCQVIIHWVLLQNFHAAYSFAIDCLNGKQCRQLRQICFCMKHAEFADDFYRQKSMKSITNQQGKHHLWASSIIARRGEQAHFWALYSAMPAATKQLKRKEGLFSQLSGRRLNRLWNRPPWGLKIFVCFVGMEFHFCFHFNDSTSLVLALKLWNSKLEHMKNTLFGPSDHCSALCPTLQQIF